LVGGHGCFVKKVQGRFFAAEAVTLSLAEGFYYTEEEGEGTEEHRECILLFHQLLNPNHREQHSYRFAGANQVKTQPFLPKLPFWRSFAPKLSSNQYKLPSNQYC
jgi:hypothetical protein